MVVKGQGKNDRPNQPTQRPRLTTNKYEQETHATTATRPMPITYRCKQPGLQARQRLQGSERSPQAAS
jgi:hypothetical protein